MKEIDTVPLEVSKMSRKHEDDNILHARNMFRTHFRPRLKDLVFHLAVGITTIDGRPALAIRCLFENPNLIDADNKREILNILGDKFVCDKVSYPLDIKFRGIPKAQ